MSGARSRDELLVSSLFQASHDLLLIDNNNQTFGLTLCPFRMRLHLHKRLRAEDNAYSKGAMIVFFPNVW
jgi:hypothetical protein